MGFPQFMIDEMNKGRDWPGMYCGYCKCDPCSCDGHGGPVGNHGICGYCHSYIMERDDEHPQGCDCDGFGGDPFTHEKPCRYCGGKAIGNFCTECGMAQ